MSVPTVGPGGAQRTAPSRDSRPRSAAALVPGHLLCPGPAAGDSEPRDGSVVRVELTALGLRRDVILDRMLQDHDEAGHVEGDVRDCRICLRRYGLDGPAEPRIEGMAPADWERLGHEVDEIRAPAASGGPR